MHIEAHAALGWTLGNLLTRDRRGRNWVLGAALLPDIDAAAFLLGPVAYNELHHTFGHNLFLGLLIAAAAGLHCRSLRVFGATALSFGLHLLADAGLTRMDVYLFWPALSKGFLIPGGAGLGAPVNTVLAASSYVLFLVLAVPFRRTPVDVFSPNLDRILVSLFRRKNLTCAQCGRACSLECCQCGQPLCIRHGVISLRFAVRCTACAASPKGQPAEGEQGGEHDT